MFSKLSNRESLAEALHKIKGQALEKLFTVGGARLAALFEIDDMAANLPVCGSNDCICMENRAAPCGRE